jgi:hypothetical protein
MNRPLASLLFGLLSFALCTAPSTGQMVLPGAAPAAPEGATSSKPRATHTTSSGGRTSDAKLIKPAASTGVASLVGRQLMLNGKSGLLQISGDDNSIIVEKLQFAGEGVSDSSQRCLLDIVGETPIEATNVGRPDGLERFEAKVSACPIAFDVLDGAVLVPTQITACVFKAADCQTTPGGLWGPDGASLVGDAATIVKERAEAERTMGKLLHAIEDHVADSTQAADIVRDQKGFAGQREELCRDYVKESIHGYCALRVTEARAALLQTRFDELGGAAASPAASAKGKKTKTKKGARQP